MPRFRRTIFASLTFIALCLGSASMAQATPLVLTITNPVQSTTAGSIITFNGTFTNPNATTFTLTLITVFQTLPTGIITATGIPPGIVGLVPALSTVNSPVLSLTLSGTAAPGTYTSFIFVTGRATPTGPLEASNQVPITIIITGAPTAVPEPATMLLLGTGLTGVIGAARRRRRARQ